MIKKQMITGNDLMITKIQEAERKAWKSYNNAKELAETDRFGNVARELEKQARTRWATLYELMQDLEIA
jgi:hypothetical protein